MSRDKDFTPEQGDQIWREAEPVEVERPTRAMTSILSVRLPREVFRELTLTARRLGEGPATLARELIERGLAVQAESSSVILARVLLQLFERMPELQHRLTETVTWKVGQSAWLTGELRSGNFGGPAIERAWPMASWGRQLVPTQTRPIGE